MKRDMGEQRERENQLEKEKKGRKKGILVGSTIGGIAAVCAALFLMNQSYTAEQAIEKGSAGNEMLACGEIIYQKEVEGGWDLIVYANPADQICSALVKKTLLFYEAGQMLGGMTAEAAGEEKVKMEVIPYDDWKLDMYWIGVIADDAVAEVRYGGTAMECIEYQGTRVVIGTDSGFNPYYYSKGIEVLDQDGNVLESVPKYGF